VQAGAGALFVIFIVIGITNGFEPELKPPDTVTFPIWVPAFSPMGVTEIVSVVAVELVVPCVGVTFT